MKAVFPPFVCHRQAVLPSAPLRARRARRRCNCSYLPAGSLNPSTAGVFYQYDPNGNLLWQQTVGGGSTGFLEHETATHYYWLPNEHGDILIGFDQGINSYAVYTDHLNTPRLVTKIENPQNPRSETDSSNDLPQAGYGEPQGISPLAIPVWQWSYSPFGADLANGYEARPTTIANNFKPELWTWVGLPETGGADPYQVAQETWRIQANLSTPPTLNIRYPGQYYDFEVGLVQNWWRTYEPRIGRYVSADPIGLNGGWNRFAYVEGDGINASDRMGLEPCLGGTWDESIGDFGVTAAVGGFISVTKVNYTCRSNSSVKFTGTQTCIGGGPIAALGAGWVAGGTTYGVNDSKELGGWSRHQGQSIFGPFGTQFPVNGSPGGSGNIEKGIGFGLAYTSCYTREWSKPVEKVCKK